jgi:16S rRNA (cytosine1402-N4)-methyltransferase
MYHRSVLLNESLEGLAIRPDGIYVDATFGGGGHAGEILKRLTTGKLYAFDQDAEAIQNSPDDPRLMIINNNFRYLKNFLRLYKAIPVDGILADLGISSHQIDEPSRGFSTRHEAMLDMRMDKRKDLTANVIVNTYPEEKLAMLFRIYGEIRNPGKAAFLLVNARQQKEISTTLELKEILMPCAERGKENKFFAQVFQALRIEVNQELEALRELLKQSLEVLKPGGRLVIISYHSLEDKLVKNFLRSGNFDGEVEQDFYGNKIVPMKLITKKAIVTTKEEIGENSRSRSARLRIAEKI